jgi:methyl-accepting chemotaxis protein
METSVDILNSLDRSFEKQFRIKAKLLTYIVLIPLTTLTFIFILNLSSIQKKWFVPIVIIVVLIALASSKLMTHLIMKRFKNFIRRASAGEQFAEEEMALIRRNYFKIPLYLAIDSGARWAIGLGLVALGLRIVAPLTITSLIIFFTVGFSNAFLSFIVYYIVSINLIKNMAPQTVYRGVTTHSFQLLNKLSVVITIIIVTIILFIASILTTVVYNLTNSAIQDSYFNQMTNINTILNQNMDRSLDDFAAKTFELAHSDAAIRAIEKGDSADIDRYLSGQMTQIGTVSAIHIASAEAGGIIRASTSPEMTGKRLSDNPAFAAGAADAINGKTSYSSTSKSADGRNETILLAEPVFKGGTVIGIIGVEILPVRLFSPMVKGITIGKRGYPFILDSEYRVIGHPNDALLGTDIQQYDWGKKMKETKDWSILKYEWQGEFKALTFTHNEKYGIIVASSAYYDDMERAALGTTRMLIIILLTGCTFIGFFIYFIIGRNLSYIHTIQKTIYSMAKGEITAKLEVSTADEVGAISADLNTFIEKLRDVVSSIKEMSAEFASSSDEMSATTLSFSDNAQSQAASAEEITATVEELSAGMDSISVSANEQNTRMASLIGEMSSLSKIIADMGETIHRALRAADTVSKNARAGEESLKNMNTIMEKITESSRNVTGIVKIINDISTQINLLSLNAAIEAARAGESGRGFAVVADEISKLADQTASSIKEIEVLITGNNSMIGQGRVSVTTSIETISIIIESVTSITTMMQEIGDFMQNQSLLNSRVNTEADKVKGNAEQIKNSTEEHKIAIVDIVRSIGNINELTQSNAGGAEEMASNAKDLSTRAETLKSEIDFFKL